MRKINFSHQRQEIAKAIPSSHFLIGKQKMRMKEIIFILAILQIILLINFIFAQSYSISERDINANAEINIAKKIVKKSLNLITGFLSIKQIGFVSAETCCEKTKLKSDGSGGAFCQEAESGDACDTSNDDLQTFPGSCDNSDFCQQGWCIGSGGTCSVSSEVQCAEGEWSSNKPSECEDVCCDAGANTQFREQAWCTANGYTYDDRSEVECKYLAEDVEGACVYISEGGNTCKFTTANDCSGGSFYENSLCSRENLNTDCEREQTIDCYNEKIYWFDSCGNRENVYEGNSETEKDSSWNEGLIKDATNYCTVDLNDENSLKTCGNCDKVTSTCKQTESGDVHVGEDNFVCDNTGCDEDGDGIKERRSGESWCIYEGQVGEYTNEAGVEISADIPGTSHYRKVCLDGEISLTNCAEYRTKICAENITQVSGADFSEAECRTNFGRECLGIDNKEDCEAKPDCRMQTVDVVYDSDIDFFKFDACVPRYPIAFNSLYYVEGDWNDGESVCGLASMDCPIVEQYKLESKCEDPCSPIGSCEICWYTKVDLQYVADKECDENPERFYSEMNDFCTSLGDCAGYINIEGNYTGRDSLKERYTRLEDISKSDVSNNLPKFLGSIPDESPASVILKLINSNLGEFPQSPEETLSNDERNLQKFRMLNFAVGAAFAFVPGWGWIVAVIAAAIEGVLRLLGAGDLGEIEKSSISFSCEPWEPPAQSEDCSKCNEGDLPCTEYKCWSLGKNCEVVENVYGVEEPVCIATEEGSVPVIEFKSVEDFEFEETTNGARITNSSDSEGCFSGNTYIKFNLTTDKDYSTRFSKCIWGEEPANYEVYKDEWEGETTSGEAFAKEHEFELNLPYYESNRVEGGDYDMYIRCENNKGQANVEEYVVDFCINPTPDITPPEIKKFEPADGSYLAYGEDILKGLKLYTDEPVISCKYSRDELTAYDDMINSLFCDSWDIRQTEYECSFGDIDGLTEPTNTIYFKCNDSHGNTNVQYTDYNILQSVSELKISSTQPKGYNQESNNEGQASMTLQVTTSGGADGTGVSKCYWNYSWTNYDPYADSKYHRFANTDATLHTQRLYFSSGSYNIPIKCEDSVGNTAEGTIQFVLDIDNTAPDITAIYHSGNSLVVKTNKNSRCYYDNDAKKSCKVEKIAENLMDPKLDLAIEHNVAWDLEATYHIQCVDNLNNVGACLSISPSIY